MQETREFRKLPNGKLEVTINNIGDVLIPIKQGQEQKKLGTFRQTAVQEIDDGKFLLDFLENERKTATEHLKRINEILDKHSGINTAMLPPDILKKIEKVKEKGTKKFREQFPLIERYLQERNLKLTNETNKTLVETQAKKLTEQIEQIKKVL